MVVSLSLTTHSAGSASTVGTLAVTAGAAAGSAACSIGKGARGRSAQVAASVLNHFFIGKSFMAGPCGREKGGRADQRNFSHSQTTALTISDRLNNTATSTGGARLARCST